MGYPSLTPQPRPATVVTVIAREVLVPVFDHVQPLDVVGPVEVFRGAAEALHDPAAYRVRLVADRPRTVRTLSGLGLVADEALPEPGPASTVLVPGGRGISGPAGDPAFLAWLREGAERAERVTSVCSGAFALAAAGLLDGIEATTHWAWADELARRHPLVRVSPDALWVRSGDVWTSAGVTAGIDLALAVVEDDHGAEVAQTVARHLVVHLRRPGGQSQFAGPVWARPAPRPSVRAAQDIVHTQPQADLRLPELARRVGMSTRHLSREFTRLVGTPPGEYVEQVRVNLARSLLEAEPLTVATVAQRCGFGSAETLRRAFHRRVGVPPEEYRKRFATSGSATARPVTARPVADRPVPDRPVPARPVTAARPG